MLRGLIFGRFISKSDAKLLKYIERAGVRERVIKHKSEKNIYRSKFQEVELVANCFKINNISDLWFGRLTKICFCLIPFRNISKKCTPKQTEKTYPLSHFSLLFRL